MSKLKLYFYIMIIFFTNTLIASENELGKKDNSVLVMIAAISLLVWIAIAIYIYMLNKKVKSLENKLNEK